MKNLVVHRTHTCKTHTSRTTIHRTIMHRAAVHTTATRMNKNMDSKLYCLVIIMHLFTTHFMMQSMTTQSTVHSGYAIFPNKYLAPSSRGIRAPRGAFEVAPDVGKYPWLNILSSIDEMRTVLKRNPSYINVYNDTGRNGLMIAVDLGDVERARLMIAYKININALANTEQRSTALHILVRKSRLIDADIAILKLLVKAGANVNALDAMGRTPLHWIGGIGDPALRTLVLDILMSHGANINIQDNNGQTMVYTTINYLWRDTSRIYDATIKFDSWLAILFKKYGSKIDGKLRDKKNYSPIDYARELGFMTVVQFLCTTGKWPCRVDDKKGYNMPTGS